MLSTYTVGVLGEDSGAPLEALLHWEYCSLFKGRGSLMERLVREDGSKYISKVSIVYNHDQPHHYKLLVLVLYCISAIITVLCCSSRRSTMGVHLIVWTKNS